MMGWRLIVLWALTGIACDAGRGLHRRRDPGTLVVARASDVQLLDPARVFDTESIEIGSLLFDGLVRWEPGTTNLEPGLAASWETSADGRVWTFHLRPGVVFHDGTSLDAAAVAFSFERLLDARHPSYLSDKDADYWRSLLKDVRRVGAVDARTVQIHVDRPNAALLGYLAQFPIVSPAAVARWGDAFKEHPVGAGPFQLEQWLPGNTLAVRRFDRYWGKPPVLDRIVFRLVVDARQRLVELESGSVDLATAILPDEQPFVELHPELQLHQKASHDVSYLAFNTSRSPFDQVAVRQAISHAVNKMPIVKLAFQGRARPAESPLPPTQWGHYEPPLPRYLFDPDRTRRLLLAAAAEGQIDLDRTYTLYALSTARSYMTSPERVAHFLQVALQSVGLKIELRLQPYAEHRASVAAGEHDLALFGWQGDTGDPDNFLYVLFHSDNAVKGSAQNVAFFRDETVDRLLIEAQAVTEQQRRVALYRAVQERIGDQAPWVPLAHSEYVVATRKDLVNVVLSPLGHPVYPLIGRAGQR
jgi:peptide/nickel transport system substrate-binding protein